MKYLRSHHPNDFDDSGQLKVPLLFWTGIIVLARAWWLAGLAAMMDASGNTQAGVLWPDIRFHLVALAAGIPCLGMLFIYPLRDRWPTLSRANYVLILAALMVMTVMDLTGLITVPPGVWEVGGVFLCLDIACMAMLWPDRWLRTVFFDQSCDVLSPTKEDT